MSEEATTLLALVSQLRGLADAINRRQARLTPTQRRVWADALWASCDAIDGEVVKLRAALADADAPPWRDIETAPKMRTILLFAVTDVDEHGTVKNWKMATGSWNEGYEDERSKAQGLTPWEWDGHRVRVYEIHPTHWMPLPKPPVPDAHPADQP